MIIGIDASRANCDVKTGIEWYSYHIIQELKKIIPPDVEVFLYTNKPLKGELAELPHNWREKVLKWPFKYLWTQGRLSLEMLFYPSDILFIPSSAVPIICPKETFTTIHDIGFKPFPECYKLFQHFYLDWSTRYALKKCLKIFTPSEFTKKELIKYYKTDENKIVVTPLAPIQNIPIIPPPVSQSEIASVGEISTIPPPVSQSEIGGVRGGDEEYILFIGRVTSKKNISRIIEAFRLFKSENLDSKLKLFLVGPRGEVEIKSEDDIVYLNYLSSSEIFKLLKNARVLLFPSLYEGFGLPILDAFAVGAPVITSKEISTEEVARNAAILVNPKNVLEIKDAIEKIIFDENLRQELIQKGRERLKDFSWQKTGEMTFDIIKVFL